MENSTANPASNLTPQTGVSESEGFDAARGSGKPDENPSHDRAIAWLKGRVKELENTVARLERDSHAPVDLTPGIRAIVTEMLQGGAASLNAKLSHEEGGKDL